MAGLAIPAMGKVATQAMMPRSRAAKLLLLTLTRTTSARHVERLGAE